MGVPPEETIYEMRRFTREAEGKPIVVRTIECERAVTEGVGVVVTQTGRIAPVRGLVRRVVVGRGLGLPHVRRQRVRTKESTEIWVELSSAKIVQSCC